ncbi:MAG: 2-succinyl-5-enolpyruvyl-6-hydroxy-3-cyclohexene-1-carboxylic-acid synthase [Actinomycetaceae bacterium]
MTGTDTSHTEAEQAPAADQPRETQDHLVARDVVRALVEAGVRDVVLAPGSRSAPLAHALHSAEGAGWLRITVRIDERVAGFVALGLSRAGEIAQAEPTPTGTAATAWAAPLPATTLPVGSANAPATGAAALAPPPAASRRPVAIVTTSGTAVANLHPAVLEADAAGIPLVLLTADRPHELRGTGANQTTQQVGIFGPALRHAVDAPAGGPAGRSIAQHVRRAVAAATGERTADPGPVQLNLGFREPLAPGRPWVPGPLPVTEQVVQSRGPATTYEIERGPRTVVIAGDGAGPAARRLAEAGSWPLLAEPSSSARGGRCAVPAYRELLDLPPLGGRIERVVVLGHPTLSRAVSRLLAREDVDVVVCAPTGRWPDAAGSARIVAPDVRVGEHGDGHGDGRGRDDAWLDLWLEAGRSVVARLAHPAAGPRDLETVDALGMAALVAGAARASGPLLLGASRMVRDVDLVGQPWRDPLPEVLSNRGLAGIDGTISTAVGLSRGSGRAVRALVGDLTFLHDVGGLLLGELEDEVDVQVVVADDAGGAIFALLGHEEANPAGFARLFTTPQRADIAALAAGYGAAYRRVTTLDELSRALAEPIRGRSVLHAPVGPRRQEFSRAQALI